MYLGKVIGDVVSTIKHHSYDNAKLLLVAPMLPDGRLKKATMVAVDTIESGIGDVVLVAAEGRSATEIMGFPKRMPLRSVIVAVVDDIQNNPAQL